MMLRNPLKSLTWNSLWRRSAGRLRRKRPTAIPVCLAAEVLEDRQLLSAANVNLSAVAGAITMSATDGGNHNVSVHRVDSTNVEFDPGCGTQITYLGVAHTSAFDVAAPFVGGVTVNLGTGYDSYNIYNLSTFGSITFNGNLAGEVGDDLEVYSTCSNMTVGGSVIFNVGNQTGAGTPTTGAVTTTNGARSYQEVFTDGYGNLAVMGSIVVSESGAAYDETDVFTDSCGNLSVGSIAIAQSGTGAKENFIYTDSSGNLTVNGLVSFTQSGNGFHENDVYTDSSGNLWALGVAISQFGSGEHDDYIYTDSSGNLTIGPAGVAITDSGSGDHYNEIYTNYDGSIVIQGSVTVTDLGTGYSEFDIESDNTDDAGDVTIWGSVYYSNSLNKTGYDEVYINADTSDGSGVVTIKGALTLLLSSNPNDGNYVELGGDFDESSTQLWVGGPVLITGGAGADEVDINSAVFNSMVTINTGTNPTTVPENAWLEIRADYIDVVGSTFNGPVSITMLGANAEIDVNDESGFPATVFNGPVSVFMQGPGASIYLSNSYDGGTPVVFNSTVTVVGGAGGFPAGTVFIDGPVSFKFSPTLINFNEVS